MNSQETSSGTITHSESISTTHTAIAAALEPPIPTIFGFASC
jgi:hypothetical protein